MSFARHLRNNATPEERSLWRALSQFRPRFTRQLKIGAYYADFACRRARVIVEVDRSQHAENRRDAIRTQTLEADGWMVIRVWNSDIQRNLDGAVWLITEAVNSRLPPGEQLAAASPRSGRLRVPRTRK